MTLTLFRGAALTAALALSAAPALAQDFRHVTDRSEFVNLISGKALTRLGIRLAVSPAGEIRGRAFGSDVTGQWSWQGDYFCRSLYYGSRNLGDNCQQVKVKGSTLRFIADRGAGQSADLTLK
ncbi:dihydrodipicolinate reductase [Oceaniglobus roseus]|uniref:dihydrodipicolinate reductase n=1 Tax=Oceaniglobus roseus TaxID=1737570 RepID=UPI000C7F2D14|nr:dihydrodipicolinate reductase [Kandeliimicrobium roseum]